MDQHASLGIASTDGSASLVVNTSIGGRAHSDAGPLSEKTTLEINRNSALIGEEGTNSGLVSFVNLTKSAIAGGVLTLPSCVKSTGILLSFFGYIFIGLLSWYTMVMIIRCEKMALRIVGIKMKMTLPQIIAVAFGRVGLLLGTAATVLMSFGIACSFLAFVAQELREVVKGHGFDWLSEIVALLLWFPLLCIFTLIPSYKALTPISIGGIIAIVAALTCVLIDSQHSLTGGPVAWNSVELVDFGSVPSFFSAVVFCITVHSVLPEPSQTMKNPKKFPKVSALSTLCVIIIYACWSITVYGFYHTAGREVDSTVINSMKGGPLKSVVITALIVSIYMTYPLYAFPLFTIFEKQVLEMFDEKSFPRGQGFCSKRVGLIGLGRFLITVAVLAVVIGIPNYKMVIVLCGAVGSTNTAFTLPALMFVELSISVSEQVKPHLYQSLDLPSTPAESAKLLPEAHSSATSLVVSFGGGWPAIFSRKLLIYLKYDTTFLEKVEVIGCFVIAVGGLVLTVATVATMW